jgi:hypothetical protein
MQTSFEYNGATITVTSPTGWIRLKSQRFNSLVDIMDIEDANIRYAYRAGTYVLAATVSVEGDLGFPVPLENHTVANLKQFLDNLFGADDTLYLLWDNAIYEARQNNDPDLLPPAEIPEKND